MRKPYFFYFNCFVLLDLYDFLLFYFGRKQNQCELREKSRLLQNCVETCEFYLETFDGLYLPVFDAYDSWVFVSCDRALFKDIWT